MRDEHRWLKFEMNDHWLKRGERERGCGVNLGWKYMDHLYDNNQVLHNWMKSVGSIKKLVNWLYFNLYCSWKLINVWIGEKSIELVSNKKN